MKRNRLLTLALAIVVVGAVAAVGPQRAAAQVPGSGGVKLWVDQRTGQVFVRPGKGRVPLSLRPRAKRALVAAVHPLWPVLPGSCLVRLLARR